jgi:hypothetical protein
LYADALLAASIIRRSSMRFSAGGLVDCMMKTWQPLTDSSKQGCNSPSLKLRRELLPSSIPRCPAIFSAMVSDEVHEKILKGALPIISGVLREFSLKDAVKIILIG